MISQTKELFSLGDLVTTKNHPYFENSKFDVLIKARAEFTPPILNIFEINIPEYFSETTGKKAVQYHCMYYDSKLGDFETKWFKEEELKLIRSKATWIEESKPLVITFHTKEEKESLINTQCILNSVDIELAKLKSNYEGSFTTDKNRITAHLDFLPPLLEIIELPNSLSDKNYDKKTGKKLRTNQQIKCKWYNPIKNTFSEKNLPIDVLQLVEFPTNNQLKDIEETKKNNSYIHYTKATENSTKIVIATIKNIVFNHYKYEIYGENIVSGKIEKLDSEKIFKQEIQIIPAVATESGSTSPQSNITSIFTDKEYPRIEGKEYKTICLENGEFYFITYKDNYDNYTKRIIKVINQFVLNTPQPTGDATESNIISSICYLRNKEERHFRLNGILKAIKINPELFKDIV